MKKLVKRNEHGRMCADARVSTEAIYELLAAYEGTELTPQACANYKKFEDEAVSKGVSFDRIVALMDAEHDGRIVVLPCRMGDTVWMIVTKRPKINMPEFSFIKRSCLTWLNAERILRDFGKSVFLTREEAVRTMEARETQ